MHNNPNTDLFISFLLWLSLSSFCGLQTLLWGTQGNNETRCYPGCSTLGQAIRNCKDFLVSGIVLRLEFRAGICIGNNELFMVKCGIASKAKPTGIAALQFHQ